MRSLWRSSAKLSAAALALAMVAAACSTSPGSTPSVGGPLIFGTVDPVNNFDPDVLPGGPGQADGATIMLTYDRLLHFDANGKLWPELAQSWTVTPTSATFTLKQGPTCSDGTPVTPEVVANSIRRMGTVAGSAYQSSLGNAGYSVTTDDSAHTVTINLNAPFSDLLIGMAMPWASIICPAGITNPAALATKPAGSGPYILSSSGGGEYTFTARPNYNWGPHGMTTKQAGYPQKLTMITNLSDESTAASELLRGQLDWFAFAGADRKRFLNSSSFAEVDVPTPGTAYVALKADGIFADPIVREAIYMALDPNALNQAAMGGFGLPTSSIIGPKTDCFDPATSKYQVKYDPAAAKALLDQDGWVVGSDGVRSKNGQRLVVRTVETTDLGGADQYIVPALQAIGAEVKSRVLEQTAYVNVLFNTLAFDIVLYPNGAPLPTPTDKFVRLVAVFSPVGRNLWHINDPALKAAVALATTSVGTQRCQAWATAQEVLLQHYWLEPVAAVTLAWIHPKTVSVDGLPGQYPDPFTLKS